jgi:hypothetical protein
MALSPSTSERNDRSSGAVPASSSTELTSLVEGTGATMDTTDSGLNMPGQRSERPLRAIPPTQEPPYLPYVATPDVPNIVRYLIEASSRRPAELTNPPASGCG